MFTAQRPALSLTNDDDVSAAALFVYYGCYGSVVVESGEKGANVDAISFRTSNGDTQWTETVHDGVRSRCARITNDVVRGPSLAAVQREEDDEENKKDKDSKDSEDEFWDNDVWNKNNKNGNAGGSGGIYIARRTAVQGFDEVDGTLLWTYPTKDYGDESSLHSVTSSPKFAVANDRTVIVIDGPGKVVSIRTTETKTTPAPTQLPTTGSPTTTTSPTTTESPTVTAAPTKKSSPTFKPNSPVVIPTREPTLNPTPVPTPVESSAFGHPLYLTSFAMVGLSSLLLLLAPLLI